MQGTGWKSTRSQHSKKLKVKVGRFPAKMLNNMKYFTDDIRHLYHSLIYDSSIGVTTLMTIAMLTKMNILSKALQCLRNAEIGIINKKSFLEGDGGGTALPFRHPPSNMRFFQDQSSTFSSTVCCLCMLGLEPQLDCIFSVGRRSCSNFL